jgi:hypothetical protein
VKGKKQRKEGKEKMKEKSDGGRNGAKAKKKQSPKY